MSWIKKLFKLKQDGITHNFANINTSGDKLTYFKPDYYYLSNPKENLGYWESLSLLRKIINAPAEDSVRNGWKIVTNLVDSEKSISVSRYIQNRLDELDVKTTLLNAIRYMRIYSKGCLVYYIVDADIPQTENVLSQPIPQIINSIQAVNLVEESKFNIGYLSESPLSLYYNKPIISIEDTNIHPTRYRWLVKDYNRKLKTGKSILDDVLEFAKTHDLSRWSISNLIFEIATKIFKSPEVGKTLHGEKLNDFLRRLRMALSSQSVLALNTEEEFQKSTYSMSGLKDVLDWITDSIAIMGEIPQARLKGAAHGVLASGNYDMMNYFESVARIQNNYLYKTLCDIISLILREKQTILLFGEQTLKELDWDLVFYPLWEISPLDQAELELKKAQRDKLDIESGKISPQEARKLDPRLKQLEQFDIDEI